jgi:soluble lytic murein transglycosylase-like protein
MFTITAILLVPLAAAPVEVEWPRFITAVAYAETGLNHRAIGKKGERGAWQIRQETWEALTQKRRALYTEWWSFEYGAHHATHARIYASQLLCELARALQERMGRPPTCADLYAAYNLGLGGYARRGYNPAKVPEVTRQGIRRLEEYLLR